MSDEEKTNEDNLKSYFKQPLKIGAGSLVLKDGVTLEAKKSRKQQALLLSWI
ncbi:90-kDa protein [Chlamydia psittaci M56]|nr:90-kDa protein [Chlamydia psittaci M56]